MKKTEPEKFGAHSRRTFLKSLGTVAATAATAQVQSVAAELEKANAEKTVGPGAVPVTLTVNGETLKLMIEPRVTLLDALRNYSSLTGAKEGCDRAACGACTVMMDDLPIYSCQKLAIEAQGREITTIEGLAKNGKLSSVQQAFLGSGRAAMRLLHAGFHHERDGAAEIQSASDRRRGQACLRRKPLPLRHASAHRPGRASGVRRGSHEQDGGHPWLAGPNKPNSSASSRAH